MKNLFYLLLFISLPSFSQIKGGEIFYTVSLKFDEGFSKDKNLKDYYKKAQEGAKKLILTLKFNEKESLFYANDLMEDEEIEWAKSFTETDDIYYVQQNSDNKLLQTEIFQGKYVINYSEKRTWKLENESKLIDGYLCYKATSELVVKNSVGVFKYPIVAWYCPSIPLNFGPKGYSGLPGLILELQERNTLFGVQKINVAEKNVIIKKPNDGKIVTQEEFDKLIVKAPTLLE
ncbi:GLPGLI family protein [Flavobacterium sp.]|uniref:GLPGLI family protein n=1 Tax=Flavobacterium sp. TaxID=239 RepID=UPI0040486B6C